MFRRWGKVFARVTECLSIWLNYRGLLMRLVPGLYCVVFVMYRSYTRQYHRLYVDDQSIIQ